MFDEQIELLIDAVEHYDASAPYIMLLYIESDTEDIPDFYFAAMALLKKPNPDEISALFHISKLDMGNMIYAADYIILKREKALHYLESLL